MSCLRSVRRVGLLESQGRHTPSGCYAIEGHPGISSGLFVWIHGQIRAVLFVVHQEPEELGTASGT